MTTGPGTEPGAPRRPSRRRGTLATLLAWCAVLLLVVSSTRWIDLTWWGVLPAVQSLAPWALAASLVAAASAVLLAPRRRRHWAVALLVAVDLAATMTVVHGWTPAAAESTSAGAPGEPGATRALTVVSANVGNGAGDPAQLLRDAEEAGADVLVLLEAEAGYVERMDSVGADDRYPHRTASDVFGPAATAVLSRLPFELLSSDAEPSGLTFADADLAFDLEGRPLRVRAIHAAPPLPGMEDDWHRDLGLIEEWTRTTAGPVVIAGDFNAGPTHPAFRRLCQGPGAMQGCGGVLPRPTWTPRAWLPPVLTLDHVLVRGVRVAESGRFAIEGSDHTAVWRQLAL